MKPRFLVLFTATTLFAALVFPAGLTAQELADTPRFHHYEVIDLGTLSGTYSQAFGISDEAWVNGGSTLGDGATHAFFWRDGIMTDLGTLGGPNSNSVFPLNDKGEVGGLAETSTPDPNGEDFCFFGTHLTCLPFIWQSGVMTALPTLGGNNGNALEVNNRGQVAGVAENSTPDPTCTAPYFLQFKPVIWDKGEVKELQTFPGDPDGTAGEINDNGQAAGGSGNCTSNQFAHALVWLDEKAVDLGNLGGAMNNVAEDINNRVQVVGASDLLGDATGHAFLWQKGVMTDLGTLPGDFSSGATGINDNGVIVGNSCDVNGNCRAFLREKGVMTDLNTLTTSGSLYLLNASGANNSRGDIAGLALDSSTGEIHAYRATPCDENHPGIEGCDYSLVDATTAQRVLAPRSVPSGTQRTPRLRRSNRYSILGLEDLIVNQERAEFNASLGLGNDAAKPSNSCPATACSSHHTEGSICGEGLCLPGHACVYLKAYDLTYKRYCYYEFIT